MLLEPQRSGPYLRALAAGLRALAPHGDFVPLAECLTLLEVLHPELSGDLLEPARVDPWVDHLLAMDWDVPEHRTILELEGLKRWVRPELEGYSSLFEAVAEQNISFRW